MRSENLKKIFSLVGQTEDGRLVVAGLFRFYSSQGLPLDVILQSCQEENYVPSWVHFYQEARQTKMRHSEILTLLEAPLEDIFGAEYKKIVLQNLEKIFGDLK